MFEILLLIGLFVAGVSQLLPEGVLPPTPKQQGRTKSKGQKSKNFLIATNRSTGIKRSGSHKNLRSRQIGVSEEQVKFSA